MSGHIKEIVCALELSNYDTSLSPDELLHKVILPHIQKLRRAIPAGEWRRLARGEPEFVPVVMCRCPHEEAVLFGNGSIYKCDYTGMGIAGKVCPKCDQGHLVPV